MAGRALLLLLAIAVAPSAVADKRGPRDQQLEQPPAPAPATTQPAATQPASPTLRHAPARKRTARAAPPSALDRLAADPVGALANSRAARVSFDLAAGTLASCAGGAAGFVLGAAALAVGLALFSDQLGLFLSDGADRAALIALMAPAGGLVLLPVGVAAGGAAWYRDGPGIVAGLPGLALAALTAVGTAFFLLQPGAATILVLSGLATAALAPIALGAYMVMRGLSVVALNTALDEQTTPLPGLTGEKPIDVGGVAEEAIGRAAATGCAGGIAGVAGCLGATGVLAPLAIPLAITLGLGSAMSLYAVVIGLYLVLPAGLGTALTALPIGALVGGLLYDQRPTALYSAVAALLFGGLASGGLFAVAAIGGPLSGGLAAVPAVLLMPVVVIGGTYLTYNAVAWAIAALAEPGTRRCDKPRELCNERE